MTTLQRGLLMVLPFALWGTAMVIKAELNKDNTTSAVIGLVNLLIVLLKLANKIKINKEVTKGIKGIRVVEFMKFPT